ncbi:MAG: HPr family phosphocarrier protein [Deltaproteobacteria bacterium]|nr:HPr family phosphocarrier protein [Deltaproteobacteria bacterium]MBW1940407.1 HPr family phosphocarrier protein [Deltaproteobacteria bacterium]MBW2011532.1 HPr family phosphocarrier protein [Deltaproteobacteria bacterium]MBW2100095.1 HPr family phosphocarrier protein [Deltaproteobacteria bacterium]
MCNPPKNVSKKFIIINDLGLHARPAAMIAKLAQNSKSRVSIIKENEWADASSIIDILTLSCLKGTEITVQIDDRADIDILNNIAALIEKGFGE